MATVSLIDPYSQQAEEIARRQRMARALQEQGSQVLEMPTTPGVLISPYAGLGKLLQTGIGAYKEKKAQEDYAKLQNEYRTNYNNQLGEMARLISAPEVKGVAGQEATKDIPGWTRPLGLDTSVSGGTEMFEDVAPVQGKPAIAPVEARPAGYISPEALEKIDIPEIKQLLMAKYLQQFETKAPIKGSPGDVFFDPTTGKERFSVKPTTTPQRGVAMSPGQELRDPITGALLATAAAKTETAALSPLGKLQSERAAIAAKNPTDPNLKTYDDAIANEVKNVAAERLAWDQKVQEAKDKAPNYIYKEEVDPTTGAKSLIKIDSKGVVSEVLNSAGTKVKTDLPPKQNPVAVKTTINGQNVTIYVDPSTLAGKQYPEQYTGIIKDLLEAQDLMKYQTDPRVIALVGSSLNKGAGLPTQEDVARYLLDFDKTKVEMAYNNLKLNVGPSLKEAPNVLTGQSSSGAATNALPLPADRDKKKLINGQTYQTDQGLAKWDAALGQFVK